MIFLKNLFCKYGNHENILISGKMTENNFYERFECLLTNYTNENLTTFRFSNKKHYKFLILCIDLTELKDCDFLDDFLFNLCVFRMIKLKGHIRMFPFDTRIKIELAHSQKFELIKELRILSLFSHMEMNFDIKLFDYTSCLESNIQIVSNFLMKLDNEEKVKFKNKFDPKEF